MLDVLCGDSWNLHFFASMVPENCLRLWKLTIDKVTRESIGSLTHPFQLLPSTNAGSRSSHTQQFPITFSAGICAQGENVKAHSQLSASRLVVDDTPSHFARSTLVTRFSYPQVWKYGKVHLFSPEGMI